MTQRQLNKLVKIQKILKTKIDELAAEQIKNYMLNGIIPKNDRVRIIAEQIKDFHKNMINNNLYLSMPDDDWVVRHGTKAQPLNYDVNLDDGFTYGPYVWDEQ